MRATRANGRLAGITYDMAISQHLSAPTSPHNNFLVADDTWTGQANRRACNYCPRDLSG